LLFAYATLRDLTRSWDVPGRRVVKISRSEVKSLTVLRPLKPAIAQWRDLLRRGENH
jgi:hypothetical protein